MSGVTLLGLGSGICGLGFIVFQGAIEYIAQGDYFLFGLRWLFSDMSRETAILYKYGGIAGMVFGGVMAIAGLIQIITRQDKE